MRATQDVSTRSERFSGLVSVHFHKADSITKRRSQPLEKRPSRMSRALLRPDKRERAQRRLNLGSGGRSKEYAQLGGRTLLGEGGNPGED